MAENIGGALKDEWYLKDVKALMSQFGEHDSLLRLKRRWLMDLPLSVTEQKRVDEIISLDDKVLPESLIREDDVSYEDIRTSIEMGLGAHNRRKDHDFAKDDVHVFNSRHCFQDVCFLLDEMTNKGLCSLIHTLTDGVTKFEKTNLSMKREIKKILPKVISDKTDIAKTKLKKAFQLLKDPNNFRGNQIACSTISEAYRAAAIGVLDGLGDFPKIALNAMLRKLKGVKGYFPSVHPSESSSSEPKRGRDILIIRVRNNCMAMLLDINEANEPSEQLAEALGVAGLTLKLIMNRSDVREFRRFSPEIESLQNDIAKAIHLLKNPKKVSLIELKKVQLLVDPKFELSARSLRMAVRNLLTEYLYECSDMDEVPDSLVQIVNIINRRSQFPSGKRKPSSEIGLSPHELMKEIIDREVEHVLIVSARAKEVVVDLLPGHEFDEDFANAYVENFDNDDEEVGDFSETREFYCSDSDGKTESIGETNLVPSSASKRDVTTQSMRIDKIESESEETNIVSPEIMSDNRYLEIQEACDATTMVAYGFTGLVLEKLSVIEGLELYEGDRLYLRRHSLIPEDSEDTLLTSKFSEMWKNVLDS